MKMKIPITAIAIFAILVSIVAVVSGIMDAKANPYGMLLLMWADKIVVDSPQNATYNVEALLVNFTIEYIETYQGSRALFSMGEARYILNNQKLVYLMATAVTTKTGEGYTYTPSTNQNTTFTLTTYIGHYNFLLENLTEGTYNLTIQRIRSSASIIFSIDTTPPNISGLSVENKTYITSNVPLSFAVDEQVSQITFSLDKQENKTLTGNTTLTSLPNGSHNLTVYANDTAGNTGKSAPVFFMVNTQPSSSPTQQTTSAPSPTSDNTQFENSTLMAIIIILTVVSVASIRIAIYALRKTKIKA